MTPHPLANHNPAFFYVPPGTEKLINPPQGDKSSDNSHMLQMFDNNAYADFRTANKHVLIPSYAIQMI